MNKRLFKKLLKSKKIVDEFNNKHIVGTKVLIKKDCNELFETKTRSIAWSTCSGYPIVLLEGVVGGYLLERIIIC